MFQKITHAYTTIINHPFFVIQGVLLFLIAGVHAPALLRNWYWYYPPLDIPMHFAGGVWVAMISTVALSVFMPAGRKTFVATLVGVFTIGVLWELFELSALLLFHLPFPRNYWPDTLLDLIMDMLGGLMVGLYWLRSRVQ